MKEMIENCSDSQSQRGARWTCANIPLILRWRKIMTKAGHSLFSCVCSDKIMSFYIFFVFSHSFYFYHSKLTWFIGLPCAHWQLWTHLRWGDYFLNADKVIISWTQTRWLFLELRQGDYFLNADKVIIIFWTQTRCFFLKPRQGDYFLNSDKVIFS